MRRALLLLALLLAPSLSAAAAAIEVRPVPVPDDPRLVLVAAPGPAEAIARDLAEDLADDWRRIEAILGLSDPRPVEIRIAYGREEFQALQPAGARPPGWAAGVAFSGLGILVVDAQASGRAGSVRNVVLHEFAHVALGRLVQGPVPRWFNEGFALHVASEWDRSRAAVVARATLARALIPLSELDEDWPHSPTDVNLAYAQSASMVGHLIAVERGEPFRRLIAGLAEGRAFPEALTQAYGKPLVVLEEEWRRSLKLRYGWLAVLMDTELLWASAALVLLVAAWRKKRSRRRRLEEMEAEEALDEAFTSPAEAPSAPGPDEGRGWSGTAPLGEWPAAGSSEERGPGEDGFEPPSRPRYLH